MKTKTTIEELRKLILHSTLTTTQRTVLLAAIGELAEHRHNETIFAEYKALITAAAKRIREHEAASNE